MTRALTGLVIADQVERGELDLDAPITRCSTWATALGRRRWDGRRVGMFWQLSTEGDRTVTWHNGRTGGYGAFLGLDRARGRAVVVLADVATDRTDELGLRLVRGS